MTIFAVSFPRRHSSLDSQLHQKMDISMVTCTAPINIALIKYWGKRHEELILPVAGSLSITLDQNQMCAKTTVAWSSNFKEDRFWLNGEEQNINNPRLQSCLTEIKKRSPVTNGYKIHICSNNNFPTAAGLASSAAGYACLVAALSKLFKVEGDISQLARRGSGSACRSLYGGFVEWCRGLQDDGSDSLAIPVAPANHWPELRVLVLVVSDRAKSVGSTDGMRNCVATSDFIRIWAEQCVPQQIIALKKAILDRDFATLAHLTMKSSNQLHALCLETYPPVVYMNDTSHAIVRLIHAFNDYNNSVLAAYTFDAGPNACIVTRKDNVPELLALFHHVFPSSSSDAFVRGIQVNEIPKPNLKIAEKANVQVYPNSVRYIIQTQLGEGPKEVDSHLLSDVGFPKGSN
ncbi:hypothetical protein CHUAL_004007 [Chamberlinius hualienensis]